MGGMGGREGRGGRGWRGAKKECLCTHVFANACRMVISLSSSPSPSYFSNLIAARPPWLVSSS